MEQLLFADARWLWVLLPMYVVWALLWWLRPRLRQLATRSGLGGGRKAPGRAAVAYSSLVHARQSARTATPTVRRLVSALRLVVVALVLLAVMRPQTGRALTEVSTEGIDIVLVIDTSGSMRALDLDAHERSLSRRRDRLEVAKGVVETFIAARPNDRIGLVVFGEEAFTQCPLTLDHGIAATFLEQLEIGMAGGATALGVKLYTIGVGTRGQAPIVVETRFGPRVVYEDVEIDEDTLRKMATVTGGVYFRAEDGAGLEEIYDRIDELEKTEITQESYMEYEERFAWLVTPAVFLLLLEVVLLDTRLRKLP